MGARARKPENSGLWLIQVAVSNLFQTAVSIYAVSLQELPAIEVACEMDLLSEQF